MNDRTTLAAYENDVVAWATEQARLLRERRFDALDIENIAEEIEDVGKAEKRELASRMSILLMHLMKWQAQPDRRGSSWLRTIAVQRREIAKHLAKMPSLKLLLSDPEWLETVWGDALVHAMRETGLDDFPQDCPWPFDDVLADGWLPH